ncbi:MAG TPA: alpha/beta hydrolase, partial [Nevskiaceae bacterium]|nr:alpha/beta hydrolase [Nevskiaceae bacterium]
KSIQQPVLVMAGDHDVITRSHTLSIYRALPHAQLWIIPDTGHDTFAQRPEAVNSAILTFLDGGARQ